MIRDGSFDCDDHTQDLCTGRGEPVLVRRLREALGDRKAKVVDRIVYAAAEVSGRLLSSSGQLSVESTAWAD